MRTNKRRIALHTFDPFSKTIDPDFSKALPRQSCLVITEDDLHQMNSYLSKLLDCLIYGDETQWDKNRILNEIKRVEIWLKREWTIFINSNR